MTTIPGSVWTHKPEARAPGSAGDRRGCPGARAFRSCAIRDSTATLGIMLSAGSMQWHPVWSPRMIQTDDRQQWIQSRSDGMLKPVARATGQAPTESSAPAGRRQPSGRGRRPSRGCALAAHFPAARAAGYITPPRPGLLEAMVPSSLARNPDRFKLGPIGTSRPGSSISQDSATSKRALRACLSIWCQESSPHLCVRCAACSLDTVPRKTYQAERDALSEDRVTRVQDLKRCALDWTKSRRSWSGRSDVPGAGAGS